MSSFNKDAVTYADEDGETWGIEHFITCPYCGWEDHDTWECGMDDGDSEEVECGNCEQIFTVSCSVSRTFQSKRLPESERYAQSSHPGTSVSVQPGGGTPEEIEAAPLTLDKYGKVTLRQGKSMPDNLLGVKIVFGGKILGTIIDFTPTNEPIPKLVTLRTPFNVVSMGFDKGDD